MKHLLLTTIAAVVLVGCGDPTMLLLGGGKSIYRAASEGKTEDVKQYLASGTDVNAKDRHGNTPLIYAKTKEMVELLVTSGADVNVRDRIGRTSLHKASGWGWGEIVELLITNGADINAKRADGAIPLHYAVYYDRMKNVEILLSKGADLNAKDGDQNGATSLHEAAWRSRKEIVDLLISKGADVNVKGDDILGETPLHVAAKLGLKEMAEPLIARGSDVNAKRNDGKTPLDLATKFNRAEIANLLRKHGGKTKKELKASEPVAEMSQPETPTAKTPDALFEELKIEEFVAKGGMGVVRKRGENKITIYEAANIGDLETVEKLLESGTDVNQKTRQGYTPLMAAGTKEIAEFLISKGASINESTIFGTALHEAVNSRRYEVAKVLLENGASVNAKTNVGKTPLDRATGKTADLLRKHGGKTGEELKAEDK